MARELLGPGTPRWVARESIAWEWLGEHGEVLLAEATEATEPPPPGTPADPSRWAKAREDVERELRVLEEASQVTVEGPDPFCHEPEALDARARRLARTRERLAEPLGSLLRAFREARFWSDLGYGSFEAYARDRLGMSGRSVRERIWLERKLSGLPETRAALRSGRISYAKALALARVAEAGDEGPRLEAAATQSAEKVERETEAEQERRDRALGFLRMWGPEQAMESIRESIASARAALARDGAGEGPGTATGAGAGTAAPGGEVMPEAIPEGRALALTGAYFLEVWTSEARRRRRPRARISVLARKDGLCQIPGCTNAVMHLHHIIFRSDGGGDAVSNLSGVCYWHHVQIHARLIRVWGRAGRRVVIEFLSAADRRTVLERWVTEGEDRTRRLGAARDEAPAPGDPARAAPFGGAPAPAEPKEGVACAG
jgi:5-methylcytosine-specific restriction endonuclease McrA